MIEGFDHLNVGLMTTKGWSANLETAVAGRFGGQAMRCVNSSNTHVKNLPSSYSTIYLGFAHREGAFSASTDFFSLRAGTTSALRLSLNSSRILQVRNSGGTVVATGTTTFALSTWYYIEVKLVVNGASGTVTVNLNGVAGEISSTVGNFGSSNIDNVAINSTGNGSTWDWDDIYVLDSTGSAPRNNFLGDIRVETIMPNSDGTNTAWVPNTGTSHNNRVKEISGTFPDGDTTYISDNTSGDRDTFGVGALSVTTGNVFGVQTNLYARKDDAGLRQISDVIRQGGTNYDGTTQTLGASYLFYSQIHNQDPTGADWTVANVNADEYGVKVVA